MEAPDSVSRIHATECPAAELRKGKRRRTPSQAPEPVRRSRRLQEQPLRKTISSTLNVIKGQNQLLSPYPSRTPKTDSFDHLTAPLNTNIGNRKRKAEAVIDNTQSPSQVLEEPHQKRPHTENDIGKVSAGSFRTHYWIQESRWPRRDFEPDLNMNRPPPKRSRSSSSQDQQSFTDTPIASDGSDQRSRAQKSSPYQQPRYTTLLAYKKSYMCDSQAGILGSEKKNCRSLLNKRQSFPSGTLFDDNCFLETFANLQDENEMRVVIDLLRLIAPSAENLAAQGMKELKCLKEYTNAGWNESIPVQGPRPQPDYCVGFRFSAFTDDQFKKLHHHLQLDTKAYFSATMEMFFPFLTSEVKCGRQALDIADRQNAHSMTVAIKGIVELFRKVGRAKELHRRVLGFSISHDQSSVRIHVHYPEIDGLSTECYRHTLRKFFITDNGGKERWAAYQFVRNVYDSFVPGHLKRIQDAIDELPDPVIESFQPVLSNHGGGSLQERIAVSASPSQEASFVMPKPPSNRGVASELRRQIEGLQKQNEQLMEERRSEREESKQQEEQLREEAKQATAKMEERLHADTAELRAQIDQLIKQQREERQESKQREDKLMDMIGRRLG